jgi:hypothetical protein
MAKETSEEKTIRKGEKKAAQKAKKAAEKVSTISTGIGGTGAAPRKVK